MNAASICLVVAAACGGTQNMHMTSAAPPSSDIVARSHAAVLALDRHDVAAATATLADGYVHFEYKASGRDAELARMHAPVSAAYAIADRTWSDERVFAQPGIATSRRGRKAREHQGTGKRLATFDGWYTLTWIADGATWKLAYLGFQLDGTNSMRTSYDQTYTHGTAFEHAPNRLLVDTVSGDGARRRARRRDG